MEVPNERTHGGVYCGAASEEKESNEEESRDGGRKKRFQRRRVETKELLKKSTSISIRERERDNFNVINKTTNFFVADIYNVRVIFQLHFIYI
jgi:hypothetical protein